MPEPRGVFIAFEGGDGAGKSTQARLLAEHLQMSGREVVATREPGGTPAAEAMRHVLLDPSFAGLGDRTEALLFAAARGDHVRRVIRPALERGAIVVCDRYVDSSLAYQGFARNLGVDDVRRINDWATEGMLPDLTVVLDVEPGVGLERAGAPDRLEGEPLAFHRQVAAAFRTLAAADPDRYLVLPAADSVAALSTRITARVDQLLAAVE